MRTLGIIPARAGSKRLPGKNMRKLGGRPLVSWTMCAATEAKRISRLVVSTNDPAVWEVAYHHLPSLPLTRPDELCTDSSPAIEYVRHALDSMLDEGDSPFDAVCILQPSSPFTTAEDIDGALELLESSGADSVVTVCKVPFMYRPCKMLIAGHSQIALDAGFGRAYEGKPLFVRNGSVYATRVSTIMQGKVIGDDCRGYVMPHSRSIDINAEDDLRQAELMHTVPLVGYA